MPLHLGELVGFPAGAAFAEDALEQLFSRFVISAFDARQRCFGRDESPFARRLERRSAQAFEVCRRALERIHRRLKARELFFDLLDDAVLFRCWSEDERKGLR
ncbi:MAG: hypothetical protein H0T92_18845 [Pyrinomonadaceae bacterium]|nr:hypothetical protein [Pyrinomonadaceae bacterium]